MTWLEIVGVVALIWWSVWLICAVWDYAEWFCNSYRFFRLYGNSRIEAVTKATVYIWFWFYDDSAPITLHGKKVRAARAANTLEAAQ